MDQMAESGIEAVLAAELARGDVMMESAGPVLRHLLANDDSSLFGDEVIARVRGMIGHLADQLLDEMAGATECEDAQSYAEMRKEPLSAALIDSACLLAHVHALALEWQLTERLQSRVGLDPVLSPLLQALIASRDAGIAECAMAMLASQARFAQQQRRMELPLNELPGDLFHGALMTMRSMAGEAEDDAAAKAQAALRADFDESRSRLGLATRLVTAMGGGAVAALSVSHAGVALFLTALALASGQARSSAIMATNERQLARLALSLRAAGLKPAAIEEQFALIHPDIVLPQGLDALRADKASAMLSQGLPSFGGSPGI